MDQIQYLEILFNDLGFNRQQRNAFLSDRFKRGIRFLDSLSYTERSVTIGLLREMRENKKAAITNHYEDDEEQDPNQDWGNIEIEEP